MQKTLQELTCRRRVQRVSLPVELQLNAAGRRVTAIIRDASLEERKVSGFIGIGILHSESLPLDEPLSCRTVSSSDVLSQESEVTLMWTRHFGLDGYLSGGRMVEKTVNGGEKS